MSGQALWAFVIVLVLVAAGLGFFFGRVSNSGMKERLREAEEAVGRKDSELAAYRREVDAHFDKTATLFVSMAGSYKSLFEHLSSGYEKLSDGSSRDLFRERVATLLIDAPREDGAVEAQAGNAEVDAPQGEDEVVASAAEAGPVTPAELAEAEEREAQRVDPAQADAEAAQAMEEERREPAEGVAEATGADAAPRRD
jgi:uncharacterized membrane-anchored protein YhcB (DUF1043 family)